MRCSGLCPRRPRGWFGLLRVLSCGKHVRCGCCRVTSQKSFPIVCRRSVRCSLMLCLRLDGWFSWCRGQSSGKSASRQRAKKYQQSYERCSRDVQAKRCSSQESDLRLARCFQQSDLPLPTGGLSNPIVRMGRSPAHVQACWAGI